MDISVNTMELKLKLEELSSLWRYFCEKHTDLYEATCDEYMHLLSSDIEKLDLSLALKQEIITEISTLELSRQGVITQLSSLLNIEKPLKLEALLSVLKDNNEVSMASEIEKYNLVLLDIIDKIQEQNKKNQVFLNKAILSLQTLRESFSGKKTYKTYSSLGKTSSNNISPN